MTSARPTVPWSLSDERTTYLTTTVGAGLLVWAWWESSGTAKLGRQTTWIGVGILAITLIAIGNLFWLMSGRRAVQLRRDELLGRIENAEQLARLGSPSGLAEPSASFVVVPGSARYHRQTCLLVRGKSVDRVPTRGRPLAGLRPCEMCEP